MRLTLRTVLAYLNGVLEPDDAQSVGRKIEECEFAARLLNRARDVVQRQRLAAPGVPSRAKDSDPNTVAEYLDNTLPDDGVPQFERACLASDERLAEVASCHAILALVLRSPVDVDPASRQCMYQLLELAAKAEGERQTAEASGKKEPQGRRPDDEHEPAHLGKGTSCDDSTEAEPTSYFWPATAMLAIGALLLAAVGLAELGLIELGTSNPSPGETSSGSGSKAIAQTSVDVSDSPRHQVPTPGERPTEDANVASKPAVPTTPTAAKADPTIAVAPKSEPNPAHGAELEPKPMPVPAEPVGRLASEKDLLLSCEPGGGWQRIPARGEVTTGQTLLSLPTYRPVIVLTAGVTVQPVGGTEFALLPGEATRVPGVKIAFGRVVLRRVGDRPTRLRLEAGQRRCEIALADLDATVAIEVGRDREPGIDPAARPGPMIADIFVASGRILIRQGADAEVPVNGPVRLTLDEEPGWATDNKGPLPAWIDSSAVDSIDRRAAGVLEHELAARLATGRTVVEALRELREHPQREVRWLAVRCLGYLGQFDPAIAALNNEAYQPVWQDVVTYLRAAVDRGPEAARGIRDAALRQFGNEGTRLDRMLWGYSRQSLLAGEAGTLIDDLDHEILAFRVLAFWNLRSQVGLGLYYRPEDPPASRSESVRRWRERWQSGTLLRNVPNT